MLPQPITPSLVLTPPDLAEYLDKSLLEAQPPQWYAELEAIHSLVPRQAWADVLRADFLSKTAQIHELNKLETLDSVKHSLRWTLSAEISRAWKDYICLDRIRTNHLERFCHGSGDTETWDMVGLSAGMKSLGRMLSDFTREEKDFYRGLGLDFDAPEWSRTARAPSSPHIPSNSRPPCPLPSTSGSQTHVLDSSGHDVDRKHTPLASQHPPDPSSKVNTASVPSWDGDGLDPRLWKT